MQPNTTNIIFLSVSLLGITHWLWCMGVFHHLQILRLSTNETHRCQSTTALLQIVSIMWWAIVIAAAFVLLVWKFGEEREVVM
jgi:hypothetical protein